MEIPENYFGETGEEEKGDDAAANAENQSAKSDKNSDDSEESDEEVVDSLGTWIVQGANIMPLTTGMIAVGRRGHKEFCFVVKPSPGSRRTDLVSFQ